MTASSDQIIIFKYLWIFLPVISTICNKIDAASIKNFPFHRVEVISFIIMLIKRSGKLSCMVFEYLGEWINLMFKMHIRMSRILFIPVALRWAVFMVSFWIFFSCFSFGPTRLYALVSDKIYTQNKSLDNQGEIFVRLWYNYLSSCFRVKSGMFFSKIIEFPIWGQSGLSATKILSSSLDVFHHHRYFSTIMWKSHLFPLFNWNVYLF